MQTLATGAQVTGHEEAIIRLVASRLTPAERLGLYSKLLGEAIGGVQAEQSAPRAPSRSGAPSRGTNTAAHKPAPKGDGVRATVLRVLKEHGAPMVLRELQGKVQAIIPTAKPNTIGSAAHILGKLGVLTTNDANGTREYSYPDNGTRKTARVRKSSPPTRRDAVTESAPDTVLDIIAAHPDGIAMPGIRTRARAKGLSPKAVHSALNRLKREGRVAASGKPGSFLYSPSTSGKAGGAR